MAIILINNSLIKHKLSIVRDENTSMTDFHKNINEISALMSYEIGKNWPLKDKIIKTPIESMTTKVLAKKIILIPILRAGLGMLDGIRSMIPNTKVGFLGMYRCEETLTTNTYFTKLPDLQDGIVLLLDPMVATGGSIIESIKILKKRGAKDIKVACIVASNDGINRIDKEYPEIDLYVCSIDKGLNEKGYIVPGLGDCGDRFFGTK